MAEKLKFSVPYNSQPEFLDRLFALKGTGENDLSEVYLSGPQEYSSSGRVVYQIKPSQFFSIVDRIHSEGMRVNLILNTTCEGEDWYTHKSISQLLDFIEQAHKKHGMEAVTIANPIIMQEVRNRFPDIEICASVLSGIDCLQKAMIFHASGASVFTPDTSINRNLEVLGQIKSKTGLRIKLMVNEGCLYKCPFRQFHFNYIAHRSKNTDIDWNEHVANNNLFLGNCCGITNWDHSQVLKSGWIRPEDTHRYEGITDYFKIVGRTVKTDALITTITSYLEENWDGDLFDILCSSLKTFSKGYGAHLDNKSLDKYNFFEKVANCNMECADCNYCNQLADKLIKFGAGELTGR